MNYRDSVHVIATVIGTKWVKVEYNGIVGYSSSSYLSDTKPAVSTGTTPTNPTEPTQGTDPTEGTSDWEIPVDTSPWVAPEIPPDHPND